MESYENFEEQALQINAVLPFFLRDYHVHCLVQLSLLIQHISICYIPEKISILVPIVVTHMWQYRHMQTIIVQLT